MEYIRQIGKNFWAVYLILITIFCYQLADIASALLKIVIIPGISKPAAVEEKKKKEETQIRSAPSTINDYKIIVDRNIFHTPAESSMQANLKKIDLKNINLDTIPLSQSGLQLVGTTQGDKKDDKKSNIAVIRKGDDVNSYHVDSPINGGRVLSILKRAVVLELGGNIEKLVLDIAPVNVINKFSAPGKAGKPVNTTAPLAEKGRVIERSSLHLDNMGDFMKQMRLEPVMAGDKAQGFRVSQIKPGGIMSKIGIINGDVIKSINGMRIEKPENAYQAYQSLSKESSIIVEVERGGRNITLNYELKD